jgi:hypothetical protein
MPQKVIEIVGASKETTASPTHNSSSFSRALPPHPARASIDAKRHSTLAPRAYANTT